MALKKTLLQIVQQILSDMDSQGVNAISDTLEAQQVADIVESTFYNIVSTTDIPEHYELIKLDALSDADFPTHFKYPSNVKRIDKLWYDTSSDGSRAYTKIEFIEPIDFIERLDKVQSDYVLVNDKSAGTSLRITNNDQPSFYSSFDDEYIVLDSYNATVDTTLQNSKIRAYGPVYPVFVLEDEHVPDIDAVLFPYLINEARSMCFELLKGGSTPKVEQAARRQKSYVQNDMYRNKRGNDWQNYGR